MSGPVKIPEPDRDGAANMLKLFTVDSVRVELVGKRFEAECVKQDPWYGGKYHRSPLRESWQSTWKEVLGEGKSHNPDELSTAKRQAQALNLELPKPNPFIPENLELEALEGSLTVTRTTAPNKIVDGQKAAPLVALAFHHQDRRFQQPKASLAFRFHIPSTAKDAASYLRCQVWCSCIEEALNEFAYDAESAGLSYSLSAVSGGLELSVFGFNDKLPQLLQAVARKMREASKISPSTFDIVKDRYYRGLRNRALKQRPCDFAARKARELSYSLSFSVEDQLLELEKLRVEDLENENERLLKECHVEALLTGNVKRDGALSTLALASKELLLEAWQEPAAKDLPMKAEAALPPGRTLWKLNGTNPEEQNNCVRLEIELPISLENGVMTSLLVRVLNPRFFEELRTKQQLGYIVQTSWAEREGFLRVIFTVQSEFPPDYVRSRMDAFLDQYLHFAENELDEAEFSRQREGLRANLAEAPKNMQEEFGRYWAEIASRRYVFDRRDQKLGIVQTTQLDDFRQFLRKEVSRAPRLYVQVSSIAKGEPKKPSQELESFSQVDRVWEGEDAAIEFRRSATWVCRDESGKYCNLKSKL
eukprot:TRINITY_DN7416_c2_g1_i1.p1 TRINITY_DN7416_c2_g1~~TRINITY_DN7416_c2_g1_i1.p1  ORF type:complete len:628 (-),score=100.91 TRINITY_DN7416_c2_g1_i1:371-2143(-)